MPIGIGGAILGAAGISGISSLIGGSVSADAARSAAATQAGAIGNQIDFQRGVLNTIQNITAPFIGQGQDYLGTLNTLMPQLTQGIDFNPPPAPSFGGIDTSIPGPPPGVEDPIDLSLPSWAPTMAQLEQTPGYQFTLDQGLKATQSGSAAAGLGRGGVSIASADKFAQGLASTTYQQQYGDYLAQNQQTMANNQLALGQKAQQYNMYGQDVGNKFAFNNQILASQQQNFNQYLANYQNKLAAGTAALQQRQQVYNMIQGPISTAGSFLSAGLGGATPIAGQIGGAIGAQGAALASGTVGAANALGGAFTNVGSAATSAAGQYAQYNALRDVFGSGGGALQEGSANLVAGDSGNFGGGGDYLVGGLAGGGGNYTGT